MLYVISLWRVDNIYEEQINTDTWLIIAILLYHCYQIEHCASTLQTFLSKTLHLKVYSDSRNVQIFCKIK